MTQPPAGVPAPVFDRRDQLEQIVTGLLTGEHVIAVYDAIGQGTGFLGITNLRLVLQDNSFVGKKTALTSVPYSRVNAVSFVSNKSVLGRLASTSSIAVSAGGQTFEVDLRGHEKARHAHDAILEHMVQVR